MPKILNERKINGLLHISSAEQQISTLQKLREMRQKSIEENKKLQEQAEPEQLQVDNNTAPQIVNQDNSNGLNLTIAQSTEHHYNRPQPVISNTQPSELDEQQLMAKIEQLEKEIKVLENEPPQNVSSNNSLQSQYQEVEEAHYPFSNSSNTSTINLNNKDELEQHIPDLPLGESTTSFNVKNTIMTQNSDNPIPPPVMLMAQPSNSNITEHAVSLHVPTHDTTLSNSNSHGQDVLGQIDEPDFDIIEENQIESLDSNIDNSSTTESNGGSNVDKQQELGISEIHVEEQADELSIVTDETQPNSINNEPVLNSLSIQSNPDLRCLDVIYLETKSGGGTFIASNGKEYPVRRRCQVFLSYVPEGGFYFKEETRLDLKHRPIPIKNSYHEDGLQGGGAYMEFEREANDVLLLIPFEPLCPSINAIYDEDFVNGFTPEDAIALYGLDNVARMGNIQVSVPEVNAMFHDVLYYEGGLACHKVRNGDYTLRFEKDERYTPYVLPYIPTNNHKGGIKNECVSLALVTLNNIDYLRISIKR